MQLAGLLPAPAHTVSIPGVKVSCPLGSSGAHLLSFFIQLTDMNTYIHTHTHRDTHNTHTHTHRQTDTHTHTHTHIHTHSETHTTHTHTHRETYTTHTHTHTHTHTVEHIKRHTPQKTH